VEKSTSSDSQVGQEGQLKIRECANEVVCGKVKLGYILIAASHSIPARKVAGIVGGAPVTLLCPKRASRCVVQHHQRVPLYLRETKSGTYEEKKHPPYPHHEQMVSMSKYGFKDRSGFEDRLGFEIFPLSWNTISLLVASSCHYPAYLER
jgi:hypothetical protein